MRRLASVMRKLRVELVYFWTRVVLIALRFENAILVT